MTKVVFEKDCIKYEEETIKYTTLKDEAGKEQLFKLLQYCVINESDLSFETTEDCAPFGKKFKEILETEYNNRI
ncbi:MAG: hypothetical protein K5923_03165 [Clostridia bacterium]|nr:hypothetical protein [Clostridia bacterium]